MSQFYQVCKAGDSSHRNPELFTKLSMMADFHSKERDYMLFKSRERKEKDAERGRDRETGEETKAQDERLSVLVWDATTEYHRVDVARDRSVLLTATEAAAVSGHRLLTSCVLT